MKPAKAEDRARRMDRLDKLRIKGNVAVNLLREFEPFFEGRRKAYFQELVSRTRADGHVAEDIVWRMVALDDLIGDLDRDVGGGRAAEKKLEEMRTDARGDVDY